MPVHPEALAVSEDHVIDSDRERRVEWPDVNPVRTNLGIDDGKRLFPVDVSRSGHKGSARWGADSFSFRMIGKPNRTARVCQSN